MVLTSVKLVGKATATCHGCFAICGKTKPKYVVLSSIRFAQLPGFHIYSHVPGFLCDMREDNTHICDANFSQIYCICQCCADRIFLKLLTYIIDYTAVTESGKVGPVNRLTTRWVAVVTPTDRHKSVRNRCVIEVFGGDFCVVTLLCWFICGC